MDDSTDKNVLDDISDIHEPDNPNKRERGNTPSVSYIAPPQEQLYNINTPLIKNNRTTNNTGSSKKQILYILYCLFIIGIILFVFSPFALSFIVPQWIIFSIIPFASVIEVGLLYTCLLGCLVFLLFVIGKMAMNYLSRPPEQGNSPVIKPIIDYKKITVDINTVKQKTLTLEQGKIPTNTIVSNTQDSNNVKT